MNSPNHAALDSTPLAWLLERRVERQRRALSEMPSRNRQEGRALTDAETRA